jgi:hypothetical protein
MELTKQTQRFQSLQQETSMKVFLARSKLSRSEILPPIPYVLAFLIAFVLSDLAMSVVKGIEAHAI